MMLTAQDEPEGAAEPVAGGRLIVVARHVNQRGLSDAASGLVLALAHEAEGPADEGGGGGGADQDAVGGGAGQFQHPWSRRREEYRNVACAVGEATARQAEALALEFARLAAEQGPRHGDGLAQGSQRMFRRKARRLEVARRSDAEAKLDP